MLIIVDVALTRSQQKVRQAKVYIEHKYNELFSKRMKNFKTINKFYAN